MPDDATDEHPVPAASPAPAVAAAVTAFGLVRGTELAGAARLTVDDAWLELAPERGAPVRIPLARVDGVREGPGHLTLHVAGGDVVEIAAPRDAAALAATARRLGAVACAIPELTRGLRALGARRGQPGTDHDRFFAPFLDAVAAARRAPEDDAPAAVSRVLTADALRSALAAVAASRFPDRAPDRRALEAELLELCEPAFAALGALDVAAAVLAASERDVRFVRWRAWCAALAAVLAAADRCWMDAVPALAGWRGAPRGGAAR